MTQIPESEILLRSWTLSEYKRSISRKIELPYEPSYKHTELEPNVRRGQGSIQESRKAKQDKAPRQPKLNNDDLF